MPRDATNSFQLPSPEDQPRLPSTNFPLTLVEFCPERRSGGFVWTAILSGLAGFLGRSPLNFSFFRL
jgi:hypothetical protein